MRQCPDCGDFSFIQSEHCKCQPVEYRFEEDNNPESWEMGYCKYRDTDKLIERVAEERWASDPFDPKKVDYVVIVREPDRKCEGRFRVTAEAEVTFRAKEI